jgi:hypothetical protein
MTDNLSTYSINYKDKAYEIQGPPGQSREQVIAKIKEREGMKDAEVNPPPGEPDFATNVLGGATSIPRGTAQLLNEVSGAGKKTKQDTGEGVVKTPKLKSAEANPNSGGYLLGQVLSGGLGGAGAAKGIARLATNAPRLAKLAGPAAIGGLTGLTDPVPNVFPDETYWSQKTGQVEAGVALGFGFGMAGKALKPGAEFLANFIARRDPSALKDRAVNTVLQRINSSVPFGAPTATDMINLLSTRPSGKPLMLADLGEKHSPLKALTGRIARSQGGKPLAATALEGRDVQAPARLQQDIAQHINPNQSAFFTEKALMSARSAAARPAYAASDELQGIYSPRLGEFIGQPNANGTLTGANPTIGQALNHGFAIERDMSLAQGRPFDPTMLGIDLDAQGNVRILRTPNMRVLDIAKQGLDKMVADSRDPVTGRLSKDGLRYEMLRKAFVDEIDALDTKGLYKKARETWQGPSRAMDMINVGKTALERHYDMNADMASRMDEGDRQFVLIGLAQTLRDRLESGGFDSNEARRLLQTPFAAKQIMPFIKTSKDAQEFMDAVARERQMYATKTEALGGSQTAERAVEEGINIEPAGFGARALHHAMHGRPMLVIAEAMRIFRDMRGKTDPELENNIAQILFDPDVWKTDMGKRLASGVMQRSRKAQRTIDFAEMLKNAPFSPGAAATAGLPSTHPEPGQGQESQYP